MSMALSKLKSLLRGIPDRGNVTDLNTKRVLDSIAQNLDALVSYIEENSETKSAAEIVADAVTSTKNVDIVTAANLIAGNTLAVSRTPIKAKVMGQTRVSTTPISFPIPESSGGGGEAEDPGAAVDTILDPMWSDIWNIFANPTASVAQTDTWTANNVSEHGAVFTFVTRAISTMDNYDDGMIDWPTPAWLLFTRNITVDQHGRIYSISAETRHIIPVPGAPGTWPDS